MLKRKNAPWVIVAIAASVAIWAMLGTAVAQKASVPKPQDKVALGLAEVKQLLLLMDTDKNGKISKQEWMQYMEAEFDRLDKDKTGELDAKELAQSQVSARRFASVGGDVGLHSTATPRSDSLSFQKIND